MCRIQLYNMSEDIVKSAQTLEGLLKLENDNDRKYICGYKTDSCLMKHEDQPWFYYHNKLECRRKPFNKGKIIYSPYMWEQIATIGQCNQGKDCGKCHSELELWFHPCLYKTKLCQKGPHPLQDYWPDAHQENEIRDVTGYLQLLETTCISTEVMIDDCKTDSSNDNMHRADDYVAPLPQPSPKKKLIKKSVSMNITAEGGMETVMQQVSQQVPAALQQQNKKNRKKKNKSKPRNNKNAVNSSAIFFLDLNLFKVKQCTAGSNHNPKKCLNYHDFKRDRRRPLGTYSSESCISMNKTGQCQFGDECKRAHNRVEEFYHPEKYKVKFWSTYPDNVASWEYGEFWSFAHSKDEIMIDLLDDMKYDDDFYMFHFKTVWCPYAEKKHARDEWVYAHNWQDFRRKPQKFPYSQEQCPQWQSRTFIQVYGDGCKNEFLWPYSHGWKEQEYHPKNFKINACRNDSQCSKAHCPYFHTDIQKRSQVAEGFKIMPKNRGCAYNTNDYLAYFIQNQAGMLLPNRGSIYHPSTAPFVNSDTFMTQPYYIIHASIGYKDQSQYSYYLNGHAEEQQMYKQKPVSKSKQSKIARTFSHSSQMNASVNVSN